MAWSIKRTARKTKRWSHKLGWYKVRRFNRITLPGLNGLKYIKLLSLIQRRSPKWIDKDDIVMIKFGTVCQKGLIPNNDNSVSQCIRLCGYKNEITYLHSRDTP